MDSADWRLLYTSFRAGIEPGKQLLDGAKKACLVYFRTKHRQADIEDAFQEALLRVCFLPPQADDNFRSYFMRVVRSKLVDQFRKSGESSRGTEGIDARAPTPRLGTEVTEKLGAALEKHLRKERAAGGQELTDWLIVWHAGGEPPWKRCLAPLFQDLWRAFWNAHGESTPPSPPVHSSRASHGPSSSKVSWMHRTLDILEPDEWERPELLPRGDSCDLAALLVYELPVGGEHKLPVRVVNRTRDGKGLGVVAELDGGTDLLHGIPRESIVELRPYPASAQQSWQGKSRYRVKRLGAVLVVVSPGRLVPGLGLQQL